MAEPPRNEFGKRRPQPPAVASPPEKRSSHVALLLMGTLAVGGSAYALMPSESCTPPASPGLAAPAQPQDGTMSCGSRSSSGSGGSRYSRAFHLFSGDSSGHSSSSGASAASESSSVSRGGFGAMAHAFGFSGRS